MCPYKGQTQQVSLCYRRAEDVAEEYCYGCTHVGLLKRKFGLKTFRRLVQFSRCANCGEAWNLHDDDGKGTRVATCAGYAVEHSSAVVFSPTDATCTQWLAIDTATGVVKPLWKYKRDKRLKKLFGAPGTFVKTSKKRERKRVRLALAASLKRERKKQIEVDDEGNMIVKRSGKKKEKVK